VFVQSHKKNVYRVLGIMSGSSLDGIDFAYCEFMKEGEKWKYSLIAAQTIPYDSKWLNKLISAPDLPEQSLAQLHLEYGYHLGILSKNFLEKNQFKPDIIASHGHTVFHRPESGFTYQLGDGQSIANTTGITVINDFRIKDIQLGGQGAPLVPIGDEYLFDDYTYCLNIGGIANISYKVNDKRTAFDICPANQILNHLARQKGEQYDLSGKNAEKGFLNKSLFIKMNADPYYQKKNPKSLSNQYVREHFIQVLDKINDNLENKLYTSVEHIAHQIAKTINNNRKEDNILITGGGAYNNFLISKIKEKTPVEVVLPNRLLIEYKEALVFALLGVLRLRGEINCLASVTGAKSDSCCGIIYQP